MGRRAIASFVAAFGVFLACGPSLPPPELNVAYGASEASASVSASASVAKWARLREIGSYARANGRRFVSKGHYFGKLDADILVNAVAAPVYSALHPGSALPEGGVVVKMHHALNGDAPGPILAVEGVPDGVSFVEMDAFGHVKRQGRIEPCVGCHAQVAGQGELFGVPLAGR